MTNNSHLTTKIFIDYDNLLNPKEGEEVLAVVRNVLLQLPRHLDFKSARCEVRVYGGWYEGMEFTSLAQKVSVKLQEDFPTIIHLPIKTGEAISVATSAELARSLLQDSEHHMFNTYRKKGIPSNIRVESAEKAGCKDADCFLHLAKKLIKTGKCPKPGCFDSNSVRVYRDEQKMVDTMLTCDLIYAAEKDVQCIVLVSGDDDFLPPLRRVTLNGVTAFRFHTRPNGKKANFPRSEGQLIEMELYL